MTLPKNIDHPCYHDDDAARIALEAIFWPYGPTCPKCGKLDTVSQYGKSMGPGWYWCTPCREKFTVRVGSVLERSHIPLHKWMLGFRLYTASKKGFSAHQLMRTLGLGSYRSAWFMAHRIREAMDGSADNDGPLGGEGKIVEADEAYIGTAEKAKYTFVNDYGWVRTKRREQMKVMTLVQRGGKARSVKVENLTSDTCGPCWSLMPRARASCIPMSLRPISRRAASSPIMKPSTTPQRNIPHRSARAEGNY